MSKCDNCRLKKETAKAFDIHWTGEEDCPYDVCPEIKTNGDRIRAMSDEELALWIAKFTDCSDCEIRKPGCRECYETCACRWHEWLKQEAKDDRD